MTTDSEHRITELEIKLTLAEDQIDALNGTVYRQEERLNSLLDEIRALRQHVEAALPQDRATPTHEIPPHY